jgi:hypothetical protein
VSDFGVTMTLGPEPTIASSSSNQITDRLVPVTPRERREAPSGGIEDGLLFGAEVTLAGSHF